MQSNCACYTPVSAVDQAEHHQYDVGKKRLGRMKLTIFKWHNQKLPNHLTNSNSLWLTPDLKKFLFERNIAKKLHLGQSQTKLGCASKL